MKFKQALYVPLGTLFLILGAIGLFVPLLPTTPFWLLTCWFYIRGSKQLYEKAMRNRYFGPHMRDFMIHKSIPLRTKFISITTLWCSVFLSSFFVARVLVTVILLVVGIGVTWHILSYPTKK